MIFFFYKTTMSFLWWILRPFAFFLDKGSFRERLGFYPPPQLQKLAIGRNLWLHAASAGEVNAIQPLVQSLKRFRPDIHIILTTTSRTGKRIALEKGLSDTVFLAPLDTLRALKRAFETFRPIQVLIAETEFWPQWLVRTAQNAIPLLLVNGRISDRSFPSYLKFRKFFSPALNCFNLCLVQTEEDKKKLNALGVPQNRIEVIGQTKYDLSAPAQEKVDQFRVLLDFKKEDRWFTWGSVREGEDDLLLPLVDRILALSNQVRLIIAPRHLKNAEVFSEKLLKMGVPNILRNHLGENHRLARVVILDTIGELSLAYALSRGAFVGGTLVPVGGHNVMEPALSRVPVCFGPHISNVKEAAEALEASDGGTILRKAEDIVDFFKSCLEDDAFAVMGEKAWKSVEAMRGATQRTLEAVLNRLPP